MFLTLPEKINRVINTLLFLCCMLYVVTPDCYQFEVEPEAIIH
jgi:hypothetical protein